MPPPIDAVLCLLSGKIEERVDRWDEQAFGIKQMVMIRYGLMYGFFSFFVIIGAI